MHFHYRQNTLFFLRLDIWATAAFLLSGAGATLIIALSDGHLNWMTSIAVIVLFVIAVTAIVFSLFVSRKSYIEACTNEAFRLARAETVGAYAIPTDQVSATCCFLRIQPPKGRHTLRRRGFFSCAYTVGLLTQGEKLIFEIRGISLVSTEIYRKTVRILHSEIRSVSFEPDPRRGGRRGTVVVTGSDGQTLFTCRCRSGHPAQDFMEYVRARIL